MASAAISVRDLGKCYRLYARPQDRLKQALWRGRRRYFDEFWALRDVSLEVGRGEALGIVGRNGSDKSTLLQIIAGTLAPSEGEVRVGGRISALLELGSGFNPEFTGRENVYLSGSLFGRSRREMNARFDRIVDFAGSGDFIDRPTKTYSSGMFLRLAFSVAVHLDPEILIVDEALAVGDPLFQHQCMARIRELSRSGVTLIFVSHNPDAVRALCDRGLWLRDGRAMRLGPAREVTEAYMESIFLEENRQVLSEALPDGSSARRSPLASASERLDGASIVSVAEVRLLDERERPIDTLWPGRAFHLEVSVCSNVEIPDASVGFVIKDHLGIELTGESVFNACRRGTTLKAGEPWRVRFSGSNNLREGDYGVAIRVHRVRRWDRSDKVLLYNDEAALAFRVAADPEQVMWFRYRHPFQVTFP